MALPIKEMNTPCDFTQRLLKLPVKGILCGISAARLEKYSKKVG
jgi:hypothetical protein